MRRPDFNTCLPDRRACLWMACLCLLLAMPLDVMGYAVEHDGIYYNATGAGAVSVTYKDENYNSYSGDVVIPPSIVRNGRTYNVVGIDASAFRDCEALTSVTVGSDRVTVINDYTFKGCPQLKSVVLPGEVTSIGAYAFSECTALDTIALPTALTAIGDYAFHRCYALDITTLPSGVVSIGERAFYRCLGLREMTLPNSVTTIGVNAFQVCQNLVKMALGKGIKTVGSGAFDGCKALLDVSCRAITPPTLVTGTFPSVVYSQATLTVHPLRVSAYKEASYWKLFRTVSEFPHDCAYNGLYYTRINWIYGYDYAVSFRDYNYNSYRGDVVIPDGMWNDVERSSGHVKAIWHDAFRGCDSLTSVTFPSTIESIGARAFMDVPGLKSIDLPVKLTSIGERAFKNCAGLETVTLPAGVTVVPDSAFKGCAALKTVNLDEGMKTLEFGEAPFQDCPSLTTVNCYALAPPAVRQGEGFSPGQLATVTLNVRPFSLEDYKNDPYWGRFTEIHALPFDFAVGGLYYYVIGDGEVAVSCFSRDGGNYSGDVTIPGQVTFNGTTYAVTAIGDGAFKGCGSLKSVSIPATVTAIGDAAFMGCTALKSVTLPDGVTTIGKRAFWGCMGLTAMRIPAATRVIDDEAFWDCAGMATVQMNEALEVIGYRAFGGCINLGEAYIPGSVTLIAGEAFRDCYKLTDVTFSMNMTDVIIDGEAFTRCSSLASLTSLAFTPPAVDNWHDGITGDQFRQVKLLVPPTVIDRYRDDGFWSRFTSIQALPFDFIDRSIYYVLTGDDEASVTYRNTAYNSYSGEVNIPKAASLYGKAIKVTAIGDRAFVACDQLKSVIIPSSVTSIGSRAFAKSAIRQVVIPNSVTDIGAYAFADCGSLYEMTLSNGLKEIKNGTFAVCTELRSIVVPQGVTAIGDSAFFSCPRVTRFELPGTLERVGTMAFAYLGYFAKELTTIDLPNSLKQVGAMAFAGMGLRELTIPPSLTRISQGAFSLCNQLERLTLPGTLKVIEGIAFSHCFKLKELVIPNSVDTIGNMAFIWCDALDSLVLGAGVKFVGHQAFDDPGMPGLSSEAMPEPLRQLVEGYEQMMSQREDRPSLKMYGHGIKSITCLAAQPPAADETAFQTSYSLATLTVPQGSQQRYREAATWKKFTRFASINTRDVNGDGEVNIADVNALIDAIMNASQGQSLDVNGDGEVNIADVNALIDAILNKGRLDPL